MKKFAIPAFVLLMATFGVAQQETVVEEIVARVNNSIITRGDLERSRAQMQQEVQQQQAPNPKEELASREKNLLRDLIDQQLLVQKGQETGINGETELIKRLDDLRKQMNASSFEELEAQAKQQGISWEDFKQNMKNNIITQQVVGREVGGHIQITRDDVQKYYQEHKADLDQPERVRLSEILIPVLPPSTDKDKDQKAPAEPTPEQVAVAQAKADEVIKKLQGGARFEDMVKAYSKGPTAEQDGDLGYFKRGSLAKELEDKTFNLAPGKNTDVIRTKQGFVILKVTDHTEAGVPPLPKVEGKIQETIYYSRMQPALREYLEKLRENSYIDIKQGFVDTGASKNQTSLVYTTAEHKGKKSRKHKKRLGIF